MDAQNAKLGVRIQTIGIIDLCLTACLLAELLPKTVILLKDYIEHLYQSGIQVRTKPDKETLHIINLINSISVKAGGRDNSQSQPVYSEPIEKPEFSFWWVFKDVFFVSGLLLVFLQAIGLIRATNLQLLNTTKAARLSRNWLLSNIILVIVLPLLIVFNLPDYLGEHGMEVAIVGCGMYLFGRGVASFSVWKFMKEVNNNNSMTAVREEVLEEL